MHSSMGLHTYIQHANILVPMRINKMFEERK